MDSSSSPIPSFQDLNQQPYPLLLFPKIEPKLELLEQNHPNVGIRHQEPLPNPHPHPNLEVLTPLQQLSPNPDEDLFNECLRLSQTFHSSYAEMLRRTGGATAVSAAQPDSHSIVPVPSDPRVSSAIVVSKKRKGRSGDMVRVSSLGFRDQMYFRDLVRRTRITYESLRSLLVWEDEKGENLGFLGRRNRADLKAAALMTNSGLWLNRDKRIIGAVPGVHIGDVFFFRMELCVIGLHGQVQAGIDYVPVSQSESGEPIATSIIVSGGYEDDEDSGDVLIYTGHGGRDRNMHKHSVDQKLDGGNLGLERSMTYGIEVRVIRGLKSDRSPTGKVYVYDGLYKIVKYWPEVGKSGFSVYKYKLLRIEGQGEMGSGILKLADDLKANPLSAKPAGYLSLDISMGKEKLPVLLFNDIDGDRDPQFFEYLVHPIYPPFVFYERGLGNGRGCECVSNCSGDCSCAKKNGGDFAYDKKGILRQGKPLIYECGTSCRCPPSCTNRVSQQGVRNRLEVFRSRETGWGVRSLDLIQAGSFVCEFSGIVLTKQQSEVVAMNGDSLIYPNRFPARWVEWGDMSDVLQDYTPPFFPPLPELSFSIDVSRMRNVACYLSHSCSPNVFVQFVLFDHFDASYPHLMIFAMENIPPLRELSIDYGVGDEWVGKLTL